jgi:ABC-type lipoprotein export system ATPase subunit
MNGLAIALRHVSRHYGTGDRTVAAVHDVSFEVDAGEFVCVVGPSGSGKSTLLNLVAGLDAPDHGQVMVAGAELERLDDDARSDLRLRALGFVFQAFHLFPTFTIQENVAWPLEFQGVRWAYARLRAAEMLEQVGIPRAARDAPSRPSCRAASSSAWPSRVRSSPIPSCSSPTSPPATSTRAPAKPSSI